MKPRVVIGSAHRYSQPQRVHRTLESAFGPGAHLHVERRDPDRLVGWFCAAIGVVLVVSLIAGWLR